MKAFYLRATASVLTIALAAGLTEPADARPQPQAAQDGGAQSTAGTGTIRGRVQSETSGEFLRNAQVRVEGTSITAYSADDGSYRLVGVPAGEATIVVEYTGLATTSLPATIIAGQATVVDFNLKPYSESDQAGDITVVGQRSGQADALMERRAAMNAKTIVPADNFGPLTMGDVGEFMKNMPGLSLDYTEVDATAVRIGGLDPKYSTFTTDGARMATATSNNNAGRQNSFEQMSITGIDSIELNNTLTASLDADSPGGNINLRSKYAFQRNKRLLRFQIGAVGTSDAGFSSIYFPDDHKHARIYPSGQIGYGDVFFDGRLGIAFDASYNANYVQQDRIQTDWSYLPNGRVLPYQAMWRPGPKRTHRIAANFAADYKITDSLTFALRSSYSFYDVEYFNQYLYLIFGTPTATQATPESTGTHIVVNPNGTNTRLHTQYSHRYAATPAYVITPRLEYRGDTFEATIRPSYSRSQFKFRDNSKGFFVRDDSWLTRIGFTMDRASEDSNAWTLTQTAGRPWGDPNSFNRDDDIGNNVRTSESEASDEMYGVNVDLKKTFDVGSLPVSLMGGGVIRRNDWRTIEGSYSQFQYVGPTNDLKQTAPQAGIPFTTNYQFAINGFDAGNMNAQNWRADNNYAMYEIYKAHPEYFVADALGNLKRKLDNDKRVVEDVKAAYVELQTKVGKASFDIGLRYEGTSTSSQIAQIRPLAQVRAAGYPTSATAATTIEGLLYQYNGGERTYRRGRYDDWFLSGGVKYDFTRQLVGQVAFSDAILRPDYGNLGGVVTIDDNNLIVTVPNPELKPEHSTKYYASLQYYLQPAGIVAASYYILKMKDMQVTGISVDPADVGFDPKDYAGYTFRSAQNAPGTSTNKGLVLEYDQQLTFLPNALRGFGLRGSFTWVDPDGVRVNLPKQSANWGLRFVRGGFDVQLSGNWQSSYRTSALSNIPTTPQNGVLYHTARELWNFSAGYKINRHFEVQVAGRNIFNAPDVIYSNVRSRVQQYTIYGSLWNLTLRGRF